MERLMYFIIYQITNLINGRTYIGKHETSDLNDGYMGSGVAICRAIKMYGKENFSKEILYFLETREEMNSLEKEIVCEDFVKMDHTYNLALGGDGGFYHINSTGKNLYGKNGQMRYGGENLLIGQEYFRNIPDFIRKDLSRKSHMALKDKYTGTGKWTFSGRRHTEKSKKLISESSSKFQRGEGNSQYGTMWIYSDELRVSKKIPKGDPIPDGWKSGRKLKFDNGIKSHEGRSNWKTVLSLDIKVDRKQINAMIQANKYNEWYALYNEVGYEEFCRITGYGKSKSNLVQQFKKYVPNYTPQNGKRRGK